ncbi:hypothetical protein E4K10_40285 [Streptomyces sp. T1317-0309]|nr:hypothetical protein E4K10_40285 [Streptomyces sp. T1317-0309]
MGADNNATSQLVVMDLTTGTVIRTLTGFRHRHPWRGRERAPARSRHPDRVTYGPNDQQIQQFSY